ncbi:hypothetical protein L6164_023906 [Bauhinia variegata]|uniref:Uncharacterized protein n=1 Tax=Bauhinia variegata TaxID=167791 RepID=A0ACB9MJL7_BAUVA|nr:hypothetical protein L6164_023906 [Bauhinia variegata]
MATLSMTIVGCHSHSKFSLRSCSSDVTNPRFTGILFCNPRLIVSYPRLRSSSKPISALNSGLEASITDSKENSAALKNTNIVVESEDGNKLQLRVELSGDQTERIFDQVLTNLARTAPPVPGFRRQKGGKTSQVPKSFLIQILGEKRVTKFVIQEILNSTMADYVKRENLDVKDRKISTTQTAEQLQKLFIPGNEFGFNVIIEPANS